MEKNLWMRRAAVLFATVCLIMLAVYYLAWPKTLRVAVGPVESTHYRYMQAMQRALKDTRKPFRFELVPVADSVAAGALLDTRKVDMAVLRSDDVSSQEARSIAVLEKRSIIVVTHAESGIDSIDDLSKHSIAIIAPGLDRNRDIIERIALHYGASVKETAVDELSVRQFTEAPKAYDAYVIIANPASGAPKNVIDAIPPREGGELSFIGMPAPDGLALRMRELQKASVPAGAFGGNPPKPKEELETVAISYELTASSRLSMANGLALLNDLVELRTRLRRQPAGRLDVEAPPVDEQRRYLPHEGAAAYVNDEEPKTFFDNWSEQIWLGIFMLSLAGSSVTGFLAWSGFFDVPQASQKLEIRMSQLARRLSAPDDSIDLDEAQGEIDDIVVAYLREYASSPLDAEQQLSLALWTNSLNAIIERRRVLALDVMPPHR